MEKSGETGKKEAQLLSLWEQHREEAARIGVKMRPLPKENPMSQVHRILQGSRTSEGFAQLEALGRLDLSMEALAVDKGLTELFSDEEANHALSRLLEGGYRFTK